ncbi:MAG: DUF1565 domain-containing protein [Deltaproteobacteria bacterium]|nr:DUF1565 domain-containing protein [Deltaproteobacteria bacterium]
MRHSLPVAALLKVAFLFATCAGPSGANDAVPSDVVVGTDAADATSCPSGLVPWPGGECAPRVDKCPNPWELPVLSTAEGPLIGGGCVAIGPRACPKLWDPEADVDCEPGQLMEYDGNACPEGFVLTDDEVACIPFFAEDGVCGENEIPVLGGGCQAVGPDWYDPEAPNGGLDVPYFDECGPGLLALEGGGCVQVGPRACPKLWDPDADVDCDVGDVLPCPEGWTESEDGMYCDPKYGECGPGERSLVGGGCERVVPLAEDCPPGPFPEVPEGATDVVYVSAASTCSEGCGTAEAPFKTISAAIAAVPDGGHVLVGPGEYAEGLLIQKPVHVLGLCSAKVTVSGWAELPGDKPKVPKAGVAIDGASGVEVAGLRITSPAVGVAVLGAKDVMLEEMELSGVAGLGLYVGVGGKVTADELWLHDTEASPEKPWMNGYGIWVAGAGQLSANGTLMDRMRGAGVYAADSGTHVQLSDGEIRDTETLASGDMGVGVLATGKAVVSVERALMSANKSFGVFVSNGAALDIGLSVVRSTTSGEDGDTGHGIYGEDGATVVASDCLVEENVVLGVGAFDAGTNMSLVRTVVRATKSTPGAGNGLGVQVGYAAAMTLAGCLIDQNRSKGISVVQAAKNVVIYGSLVRKTMPQADADLGIGLALMSGGAATVSKSLFEENKGAALAVMDDETHVALVDTVLRTTKASADTQAGWGIIIGTGATGAVSGCLVENNVGDGIVVTEAGAPVELLATVVRDTAPGTETGAGSGVYVEGGSTVVGTDCLFERSTGWGVLATGPETRLELVRSAVRDTESLIEEGHGFGMLARDKAALVVSSCLVEGSPGSGIDARDSGTGVELSGSVVRNTKAAKNGTSGHGMDISSQGAAEVSGCLFEANTEVGIAVAESGSMLAVSGTAVRDTAPNGEGVGGIGLQASYGGTASVSACLLSGNALFGVALWHPGTSVDVSASVVRHTVPDATGYGGHAMELGAGATATVSESLFEENVALSIFAFDGGTRTDVSASVVRGTEPDSERFMGYGIQASEGAIGALSGCLLEQNTGVALLFARPDTRADVLGTIVRDTRPNSEGFLGSGLAAQEAAHVMLRLTLFDGNATTGVSAFGQGTVVEMAESAVLDTQPGGYTLETERSSEFQVCGDGILAAEGSTAVMLSTFVSGDARNGIYFNQSEGSVTDSVIVNNDFYGLAMEECADQVAWEGQGNHFLGNAAALPSDKAAQVTTSTGGMAVPPAPEMIEIPSGPGE